MKQTISLTFELETTKQEPIPEEIRAAIVHGIFQMGAANACHLNENIKTLIRQHSVNSVIASTNLFG